MTMHTELLKENEGIVHNPVGQLSSAPVHWWSSGIGTQPVYSESVGQLKYLSLEQSEQGLEKGNTTRFTVFPVSHSGNDKSSANGQSAPPNYPGCFKIGYGQPVICGKYSNGDQSYGVFSTYGPQITGRIMLPLSLTTDDGPMYVNAKQYHGIIRRRLSRAKAESKNKLLRDRKPFLHLSRHLHAKRRPRGCGGRFLNTKTLNGGKDGAETEKTGNDQFSLPTESQNSEVLRSDNENLNSPKEYSNASRSNLSGSEVTSFFSRVDLNRFTVNHLRPSAHYLSDMLNTGHEIFMPSKRVAAADHSSCNLKV